MKFKLIFFSGMLLASLLHASDDLLLKNNKTVFCFDAHTGALKKIVCGKEEFPILADSCMLVAKDGNNVCTSLRLKEQRLAGTELQQTYVSSRWEVKVIRKLLPGSSILSRKCIWKRIGKNPIPVKAIRMELKIAPSGKAEENFVTHPCGFPAMDILLSSEKTICKKSGGEHLPGVILYQKEKKIGLSYTMQTSASDFEIISKTGKGETVFSSVYNVRTTLNPDGSCESGTELLTVGEGSLNDLAATLHAAWEKNGFRLKERPSWTRGAVLYSAYVQGSAASRHTDIGTLENFRKDVLPHLQRLGVSILWLNPFNQGRYGLYSFDFEKEVGTKEDLKRLTEDAQKRGIRVLMDLLLHGPSPKQGALAPWIVKEHPEWISRGQDGKFKFWWGGYCMDYANPDYQKFMAEFAAGYVRECGISGWRVDCARQSPDNERPTGGRIPSQSGTEGALKMMHTISDALEKSDPQSILLGETHTTVNLSEMAYIYDTRVGGNYFTQIINRKVSQFVPMLKKFFARDNAAFPAKYASGLMRYSENHDIPPTLRRYGSGHRDAYFGLTFLIPGLPLVNMEQERGVEILIKKLAEIRKRPEFVDGEALYEETISSHPGVFTFTRFLGKQFSTVAVNFCGESIRLVLTLPEKCKGFQGNFCELVNGTGISRNDRRLEFTIQPYHTCVIAFSKEDLKPVLMPNPNRPPMASVQGKEILENRFWKIAFVDGFPVSVYDKQGREIAPDWHLVADHRLIRDGKEKNLCKGLILSALQRKKQGERETLVFTGKRQNGMAFQAMYSLNGKDFSVRFTGLPAGSEGALEVSFGRDPSEWFVSALEGALHGNYDPWHTRGDEFKMHEADLWLRNIRISHIVQKSGVLYESSAQTLHPRTGQLAVKKGNFWTGIRFSGADQEAVENLFLRENGTIGGGLTMRLIPSNGKASFTLRSGDNPLVSYGPMKKGETVFSSNSSRHVFRNHFYELIMNRNQGGNTGGLFSRGNPILWSSRIYSNDGFFFPKTDPERSKVVQTIGNNGNDLEAGMRFEEKHDGVRLIFSGELKKDGGHRYSALPKTSYQICWMLDESKIIRYRSSVLAKPVEAYQLKERGASSENLKGSLRQEFQLSGVASSVKIRLRGKEHSLLLKGNSDAGLFRSGEVPEELAFYRENGLLLFKIANLRLRPAGVFEIRRQKGINTLQISLLKADGRQTEQDAEFLCHFILP